MTFIDNAIVQDDLKYIDAKLSRHEKALFQNATVLVTGCAGFIGYYLMTFLALYSRELGIKRIIGLDNFILRRPLWIDDLHRYAPNIDIHTYDIVKSDINSIPFSGEADIIIHMASIASPTFYRKYPLETLDANIWGLRKLLDFYYGKSVKRLLFLSSSEVYGDPAAAFIPTDEDYRGNVSTMGPRACYDEAKRFGETLCYIFSENKKMPITIARPFNNYGPGMNLEDRRVPADFAKAIIANRDIEMFSDGTPTRTFCYVADAVVGFLKVLAYQEFDCFNIGASTPEISIKDLAEIYSSAGRTLFGYTGSTRFTTPPDVAYMTHNPNRRCPNIEKARSLLAYNPEISIADGVSRFLKFVHETRATS